MTHKPFIWSEKRYLSVLAIRNVCIRMRRMNYFYDETWVQWNMWLFVDYCTKQWSGSFKDTISEENRLREHAKVFHKLIHSFTILEIDELMNKSIFQRIPGEENVLLEIYVCYVIVHEKTKKMTLEKLILLHSLFSYQWWKKFRFFKFSGKRKDID